MRILYVADIHYSLKQFDWVLKHSDDFDAVVIAGDLLDLAGHAELDSQIVVVCKYLNLIRERVPLIVSSGNHDGDEKNENDEYITQWLQRVRRENLHVDGDSVQLGDDLITVCPWWDGPVSRDAMMEFLDVEKEKPRKRWIWIHHAPPSETKVDWTGKKNVGDTFLREIIETHAPDFVFSGHIHDSPFRNGGSWVDRVGDAWVFNPGRQLGELPPYIVVDLDEMTARWDSLMDVQEVDLTKPSEAPRSV